MSYKSPSILRKKIKPSYIDSKVINVDKQYWGLWDLKKIVVANSIKDKRSVVYIKLVDKHENFEELFHGNITIENTHDGGKPTSRIRLFFQDEIADKLEVDKDINISFEESNEFPNSMMFTFDTVLKLPTSNNTIPPENIMYKNRIFMKREWIGKNYAISADTDSGKFLYLHDDLVEYALSNSNIGQTDSWNEGAKEYHWSSPPMWIIDYMIKSSLTHKLYDKSFNKKGGVFSKLRMAKAVEAIGNIISSPKTSQNPRISRNTRISQITSQKHNKISNILIKICADTKNDKACLINKEELKRNLSKYEGIISYRQIIGGLTSYTWPEVAGKYGFEKVEVKTATDTYKIFNTQRALKLELDDI